MNVNEIKWTEEEMIEATVAWWDDPDIRDEDCRVIQDEGFLVVLHVPTGRTSSEAGDGGRWNLDGTALF